MHANRMVQLHRFCSTVVSKCTLHHMKQLESNLQGNKILEVGDLLKPCDRLRVQYRNHTEIPFLGWIDMKFELSKESASTVENLQVPFLVIKKPSVTSTSNENTLINSLQSKVKKIKSTNIKALDNLISQSTDHNTFLVYSMPSRLAYQHSV